MRYRVRVDTIVEFDAKDNDQAERRMMRVGDWAVDRMEAMQRKSIPGSPCVIAAEMQAFTLTEYDEEGNRVERGDERV